MQALGQPGVAGEGRFFPDTYAYSRGVSDLTVLRRAHAAMQRRLDAAWAQRSPDTPLRSADEALDPGVDRRKGNRPEGRPRSGGRPCS